MTEPFSEKTISGKSRRRKKPKPDRWLQGLGTLGLVGWTVALPALVGTALGLWLDRQTAGGVTWTLGLLTLGAALGAATAWRWVQREESDIFSEEETRDD